MPEQPSSAVGLARAFTDAMNARAHDEAAQLLAPDVVLIFPGGHRLDGREAWLESRRRQQPPEHLSEEVVADAVSEVTGGAEIDGRLVQRWVETGEVANEQRVRIVFAVEGGLISRLEFAPAS